MNKAWQDDAWEDYLYWQTQDKKTLKRINLLLKDIDRLLQMHDCGYCDDIGCCCDDTQCTVLIIRKKIREYFEDVHTVRIGNIEVK